MTRLETGDRAPTPTATDDRGRAVSLADLVAGKLVLYFYPKAFTPGCTTESCDFRDRHEAMRRAGYEIVGVSPDPPEVLAEFRSRHRLPFPLLSDPGHVVAAAFGAWGTKKNYGREYEGLIRSTFVIEGGTIRDAWYNVKADGHAARVAGSVA
ncbi:MAG: peroxiredoxin [Actinobacteria bacterium]|nr:MAG: peroxiredoxin [Actinomycetota bacterium]